MSEAHTQKMKALQEEQRSKVAEATDLGRGLILVHTGDGKGKSSSAFGVIARALGWGHSVSVVQFIKGKWVTGERRFFEQLGTVTWHTMGDGFTWDTQDKTKDTETAWAAFSKATELMQSGNFDLVVLDEVNVAMSYGYLDVSDVVQTLERRQNRTSVVLTGRNAPPALCDYADLVTEMREIKHPFKAGIKAQRGIDF